MTFEKLYEKMMVRMDFRAFFLASGVEITGEADEHFWLSLPSIFTPGKSMRINLRNGNWSEELLYPDGSEICDFVIARRKWNGEEFESKIKALKELCDFCGMQNDFQKCQQPTPPKQGAVEPITTQQIESWRKAFINLHERFRTLTGINAKTATKYQVGWIPAKTLHQDQGAFIVPIPDYDGVCRSARLCNEALESTWTPHGMAKLPRIDRSPKLFGVDEIHGEDWKTVFIVENEFDRMIFMQERERFDWGAVSLTGHEYMRQWNRYFEGRAVVICCHAERKSKRFAECVMAPLLKLEKDKGKILSIKLINLPLSGLQTDKCLIHWFKAGGKWVNFQQLVESTGEWIPPNAPAGETGMRVLRSFSEIDDPVNTDIKVQVPLTISGETNVVYDSPTQFDVRFCSEIQSGRCTLCLDKTFEIPVGNPEHIASYMSSDAQRDNMCREICCPINKKPKINVTQKATFREVVACQYFERIVEGKNKDGKLETRIDGRYEQLTERRVYVRVPEGKSEPLEPRGYNAIGWIRTNPKNSNRTLLVESLTPIQEGHESFLVKDHVPALEKLRNMGWEAILNDLTNHVTMIFGYDELLLITLLTYCSPLSIRFNGDLIRGWITAAVIGDSGVGKSKVFERISDMIGVGDIFSCLTGRRTGLTYSIVKTASSWRCQAGLQPRNTRKIMCVEEAQDMPQRDIKSMAIAMDTGRMDVEGVARGSYETKTRLLFNCNCANERTLAGYPYGCLAIRDLFSHMFIRRIDIAAFVRRMENGNEHYNRKVTFKQGLIAPEEFRALVYFAWTLTADRIKIDDEVTQLILDYSKELSETFGGCDDIPLVCPSDFRNTLARLATALAILDVSTEPDFSAVNVRMPHVKAIKALVTSIYASTECGLDQYSNIARRQNRLDDYSIIESDFSARINAQARDAIAGRHPFPRLIFVLNRGLRYSKDDLKRLLMTSDSFLNEAVNFLAAHHLVNVDANSTVFTTPKYNRFLKRYCDSNPEMAGVINLSGDHVSTDPEPVHESQ